MSPRKTEAPGKSARPATKTASATTARAKSRPPASAPARSRARPQKAATVDPAERQRLIAEAAYFKAERRGFAAGGELADWIEAEAEIDALLGGAAPPKPMQ
ncbi:MAG: DUF2934 domain-containing protein [Caenispirillum sp.]|jgi:hypothetical protein|nr:DUF2934 domain-containing protein [Caenispirillum sp.]